MEARQGSEAGSRPRGYSNDDEVWGLFYSHEKSHAFARSIS